MPGRQVGAQREGGGGPWVLMAPPPAARCCLPPLRCTLPPPPPPPPAPQSAATASPGPSPNASSKISMDTPTQLKLFCAARGSTWTVTSTGESRVADQGWGARLCGPVAGLVGTASGPVAVRLPASLAPHPPFPPACAACSCCPRELAALWAWAWWAAATAAALGSAQVSGHRCGWVGGGLSGDGQPRCTLAAPPLSSSCSRLRPSNSNCLPASALQVSPTPTPPRSGIHHPCVQPNAMVHELGHNLFLGHAGGYDKGGAYDEYQDDSGMMG